MKYEQLQYRRPKLNKSSATYILHTHTHTHTQTHWTDNTDTGMNPIHVCNQKKEIPIKSNGMM
jgi:hypothetical protein